MKIALHLVALSSLAALVIAAAAETAGVTVPTYLNAETALGVFAAAFVLLTFASEYFRRPPIDQVRSRAQVVPAALPLHRPSHGVRLTYSPRRTARHALAA